MAYPHRYPGVKGVHLMHKEEYRDIDGRALVDRLFAWALVLTALFVLGAVLVTK